MRKNNAVDNRLISKFRVNSGKIIIYFTNETKTYNILSFESTSDVYKANKVTIINRFHRTKTSSDLKGRKTIW